jgi:hypothetical protein
VAVVVVDLLEAVEVEEEQRGSGAGGAVGAGVVQITLEGWPVPEPGQMVGLRANCP